MTDQNIQPEPVSEAPKLTNRQRAFIEHYLRHWDGARAAREAGYSLDSARVIAAQNLTKLNIQAAIQARLNELKLSADETLLRLGRQARSSFADVLTIERVTFRPKVAKPDPDDPEKTIIVDGDEQERVDVAIDWEGMRDSGALDLLKKVKWGQHGPEIEMYDAQAALVHIGKHHGLFVEKQEVTHTGDITIKAFTKALDTVYADTNTTTE